MAYSRDAIPKDQRETRERDQQETRERQERDGAMADGLILTKMRQLARSRGTKREIKQSMMA